MEGQALVGLERGVIRRAALMGVVRSGASEPARAEVPCAQLVLLRVEILLAAGSRGVLSQLVRRAVNAVVRGQRRGQHEPRQNAGAAAGLQVSGRMSGVFGQKFGRKYSRDRRLRELGEILAQLLLGLAPGEVGVRLGEAAAWPGAYMTLGRVNASARKITSGCSRLISAMHHSQKANAWCAGCRRGRSARPAPIQKRTRRAAPATAPRQSSLSKSNG